MNTKHEVMAAVQSGDLRNFISCSQTTLRRQPPVTFTA